MKNKIVNFVCDNIDKIVIGIAILTIGATGGILGYLIENYDV